MISMVIANIFSVLISPVSCSFCLILPCPFIIKTSLFFLSFHSASVLPVPSLDIFPHSYDHIFLFLIPVFTPVYILTSEDLELGITHERHIEYLSFWIWISSLNVQHFLSFIFSGNKDLFLSNFFVTQYLILQIL